MKLPPEAIAAGIAAESEAKWHISRKFEQTGNYRVLHNVVIPDPHSNSPCQIDHLIIGRFLNFIVCETKSTKGGCTLKKENGAWGLWRNGRREPMASPIEQNKRHIQCLEHFLKNSGCIPSRLGIPAKPNFDSWILVDPGSDHVPTRFDNAKIIPRDMIGSVSEKWIEQNKVGFRNMVNLLKIEQLDLIANTIQPPTVNTAKTVAPTENPPETAKPAKQEVAPEPTHVTGPQCDDCKCPVDNKVVYFCRLRKADFGGKLLCQSCQITFKESGGVKCNKCHTSVTSDVVKYCKMNWAKMGKQILCRGCQPK